MCFKSSRIYCKDYASSIYLSPPSLPVALADVRIFAKAFLNAKATGVLNFGLSPHLHPELVSTVNKDSGKTALMHRLV